LNAGAGVGRLGVDLTEFTQLDDDDAESLGRHESDLSLEGHL